MPRRKEAKAAFRLAKSSARLAARATALERHEAARGRAIAWRVAEARALIPLREDQPAQAAQPLRELARPRRALLIINSKSGPNRDSLSRLREIVDHLTGYGFAVKVRVKLRKKVARGYAREAARAGYQVVIAAGGDGTVEAVASGLVGSSTALGIIPLGTYNNLAFSLGIPSDLPAACALIGLGNPHPLDCGRVRAARMKRPRLFLEMATIGLGAALAPVGQDVEKGRWGQALASLPSLLEMTPTLTGVTLDGNVGPTARTLLMTIANAPRAGAALMVAPEARMDDGLLDLAIYPEEDRLALAARFAGTRTGRSLDEGALRARARRVEVRTSRPLPVAADSRLMGVTPARVDVLPAALWVFAGDGPGLRQPLAPALAEAAREAAGLLTPPGDSAPRTAQLRPESMPNPSPALPPAIQRAGERLGRPALLPLATAAIGAAAYALARRVYPRR